MYLQPPPVNPGFSIRFSSRRNDMSEENIHEIRVREVLDEKWVAFFAPFSVTVEADETILTGVACDQAELFGVLLKIRDLGLTLISANLRAP
jgi:hypothetical protein